MSEPDVHPVLSAPVAVELIVTEACNHRCPHCFNPCRPAPPAGAPGGDAEAMADALVSSGVMKVIVSGGEPLTRREDTLDIIRRLQSSGIEVSLNTNATLADDKLAQKLASLDPVPFVFVSLPSVDPSVCDAMTGTPGSLASISRGIGAFDRAGLHIGINVVVTKANPLDADGLSDFVRDHTSIVHVSASPVVPPSYDPENPDYDLGPEDLCRMCDALEEIGGRTGVTLGSSVPMPLCIVGRRPGIRRYMSMCCAGRTHCTVYLPTGEAVACSHEVARYGNIYEDGLPEVWSRMGCWRDDSLLPDECMGCNAMSECSGLCRMMTGTRLAGAIHAVEAVPRTNGDVRLPKGRWRVADGLKMRDEAFGGVLMLGNDSLMVRSGMYALIGVLKDLGDFSVDDLDGIVDIDSNLASNLDRLIRLGVLEASNPGLHDRRSY